jgi:threonine aldolase
MAARLATAVDPLDGVEISHPVEANAVFARLPRPAIDELLREHRFYVWDEQADEVRWMCAWDTAPEDVDGFAAAVAAAVGPT